MPAGNQATAAKAGTTAFICPTHKEAEHHSYTRLAVASFLRYCPNGVPIVIDDASPDWDVRYHLDLNELVYGAPNVYTHRFEEWGGLTRSWNYGLRLAFDLGVEYVIVGNNDILFCEGWQEGLLKALAAGYALAGPISNAPGITAGNLAEVGTWHPEYQLTDEAAYLNGLSAFLRNKYAAKIVEAPVNGFFQMAKAATWYEGRFDEINVYKPRNDFTSKGKRNPTPLMTLNEDELQGRWRAKGWKTAVCPSSFIFHYRSVTRGPQFCRGRSFRMTNPDHEV